MGRLGNLSGYGRRSPAVYTSFTLHPGSHDIPVVARALDLYSSIDAESGREGETAMRGPPGEEQTLPANWLILWSFLPADPIADLTSLIFVSNKDSSPKG